MAQSVDFTLVVHNHQPVGNFEHVFADAAERAYLPFLRTLEAFPAVRIGLHTSGVLWEWLDEHRPEYGELVAELLARDQVELLGGGMYEPILPVLPYRDALWQLTRMNEFLGERFSVTPKGMWLAERVWEPHLPEVIAAAGLKYVLLDDHHFAGCAPDEDARRGYFMTSHAESEVALLPIAKQLRYTIPFKPPQDTLSYLRELMEGAVAPPLAVFGDDGEKFGVWPDTHDWVYGKGWLREFFAALIDAQDWVHLRLPGEVVAERQPAGHAFIPARSYEEMGQWTHLGEDAHDGMEGHWRNFFAKYPESRAMYERVNGVSGFVYASGSTEAQAELGRAQCNCAYWHGVFGGLYLNYLRQAITQHLLSAELKAGAALGPRCLEVASELAAATGNRSDAPVRIGNATYSLSLDPAHGLSLARLDYYPTRFCWTDVLARRREQYHSQLLDKPLEAAANTVDGAASIHEIVRVKEPGLRRRLVFDPHPRHSFVTYFSNSESAEKFLFSSDGEVDTPLVEYVDWEWPADAVSTSQHAVAIKLTRGAFSLSKRAEISGDSVEFTLGLTDPPRDAGQFFVEFNLTILTDQADDRKMEVDGVTVRLAEGLARDAVTTVALVDGWQQRRLTLTTSTPAKLITYPVYTISSSEAGFERTYQGACIMLGFDPRISKLSISLSVREL